MAQVPAGTTSNHFRSRLALLRGMVDQLLTADAEIWRSTDGSPDTAEEAAEALASAARRAADDRTATAARYALFLEAMHHPELADSVRSGNAQVLDWMRNLLSGLGIGEDVDAAAAQSVALLDGVIVQSVVRGQVIDARRGFASLLRGWAGVK
ncbi:TetR/AcrR family transcriptional regulator [Jongsikchunia kroppenstedtii]|uniref:TetR/AcrR family transcriptional regulator n=1 Tax=Jongsikchunia kroppenstedtii TaxID=1121721 RepID=UPI0012DD4EE7|nr:TetR family transcriptional regulator C-terminal domain-containing protein [Jongsikchunia kroppenstedtii]